MAKRHGTGQRSYRVLSPIPSLRQGVFGWLERPPKEWRRRASVTTGYIRVISFAPTGRLRLWPKLRASSWLSTRGYARCAWANTRVFDTPMASMRTTISKTSSKVAVPMCPLEPVRSLWTMWRRVSSHFSMRRFARLTVKWTRFSA